LSVSELATDPAGAEDDAPYAEFEADALANRSAGGAPFAHENKAKASAPTVVSDRATKARDMDCP
jgi:hypothetical protein